MTYRTEFPAFPADAIPADVFGDGWTDTSYRHDVAPSFEFGRFVVFVDYPEPSDRELENVRRFCVYEVEADPATGIESDTWADILTFIVNGGR